jgi:murein DD-endopeptidase MepM/ murein hydrolase activator NlpD
MNKRIRYGKPKRVVDLRKWLAGASRYLTHLSVLVIAVGALLLATVKIPQAQGASPQTAPETIRALPNQSNASVSNVSAENSNPNAVNRDEDSILRDFAPIRKTNAVAGTESGASQQPARGLVTYTVQSGDTLFGIASAYGLRPETVLWSNYGALKDNPDLLSLGMQLQIPPTDGLITTILEGDSIDSLARQFQVKPEDIAKDAVNNLTSVNQALVAGQELFIPGGQRETVVWQVPKPVEVRQSSSGVKVYSVGVCGEVAIPALGTGHFIYPANAHYLSGYNFSAWHPGIDIAGHLGNPIYAADSGTVIYAGYSLNKAGQPVGYGQYVVIDHGNGYQTLYAHASQLFVSCGQQVLQGTQIAAIGSVGNSTGPHLHFEIRHGGTAMNPWSLLPSP